MSETDRRQRLAAEPFAYRATKDGKVLIYWQHKLVLTLKGKDSAEFLARIATAAAGDAQLIMAKASGNFKRGNETKTKRRS